MMDRELRLMGLGGSDQGALFGCDGDRDAHSLWVEKKGGLPPMPPTDRMRVGKALETGVLELYSYVTDRAVNYCDVTSRHPERPWQIYTPDALCQNERRGVDAKVVSWDQRHKWGATADEIPERVQLQMWWYMSALNFDVWDVAAFLGDGLPRVYEVHRDREAERVMLARAEEFYRRYLVGNEMPPIGGTALSSVWLQQAFPTHKRPDLRQATDEEIALLDDYAGVRLDLNELSADRARLEAQIKLAIGEREGLIWETGRFTWRLTKPRTVTDWESVSKGLLNTYVTDPEMRETLINLHSHTKRGTRRIWFDSALMHAEAEEVA